MSQAPTKLPRHILVLNDAAEEMFRVFGKRNFVSLDSLRQAVALIISSGYHAGEVTISRGDGWCTAVGFDANDVYLSQHLSDAPTHNNGRLSVLITQPA